MSAACNEHVCHKCYDSIPGSFAAPMKPKMEEAASKAPMTRNCFFGVSSIGCVTIPALSLQCKSRLIEAECAEVC